MKAKILLLVLFVTIGPGANAQHYEWVKPNIGTALLDYGIETDGPGNVYTMGNYGLTIDLDPTTPAGNFTGLGNYDFYLAKYDSLGNLIWANSIGSPGDEFCFALEVDASGNIYVTGYFTSTCDFDPGAGVSQLVASGNYSNIFFAKYNSSGGLVWVKKIGGTSGHDQPTDIAIDATGNVYLTGFFQDTCDFDPGTGIYNLTADTTGIWPSDIFFAKYDDLGDLVWVKEIEAGNPIIDAINNTQIKTDDLGNVCLAGSFSAVTDFDPGMGVYSLFDTSSAAHSFLAKYDATGNFVWANEVPVTFSHYNGLEVDLNGAFILSGRFSGVVDVDAGTGVYNLGTAGGNSFFLQYDATGNFAWANEFPEGLVIYSAAYVNTVCTDSIGNIYIGGNFSGLIDFDAGPSTYYLNAFGMHDAFFAKYTNSGDLVWVANVGGPPNGAITTNIDIDDYHNLYVLGWFQGTADFDPSIDSAYVTSVNYGDIFVARYSQSICSPGLLNITGYSPISCTSNATATAILTGVPQPYTYQWNTVPVTNSSILNVADAGIYTVQVTDSNNCNYARMVVINGPTPGEFDLSANLTSTVFRTGFPSTIWLDGYNTGCALQSGILKLVLDTMLIYTSASPTPDTISGDTLSWNFSNLTYDSLHLTPVVFVSTPTFAAIGDTIHLEIKISSFPGEADLTNNFKMYDYPVINSYDPNDKQVYPRGEGVTGNIVNNQKMTYTIRFQNTGNADAINIYLLDHLDADLDISTLKVIGSSHQMTTEILPFNVLKFKFDNINLADSFSNEALSHGYVIYEVEQMPNLPLGTQIVNSAEIYFDFNSPIYTNTVLNTIYSPVGIHTIALKNEADFVIYPNPGTGWFTLKLKSGSGTQFISIKNAYGQEVYQNQLTDKDQYQINLNGLAKGIYFVELIMRESPHSEYRRTMQTLVVQ